ncbi:MAG: hypothetical protein E7157_04725 [Lactobacillales bacterium]|nr:hypothetical protein [Lactobacillales bacterium]
MSNNMTFPKRKVLKKWARYSLLGIIITFFISSIVIILTSFNKPDKNEDVLLYSYNVNQDLDYKVNLYDNSYIESSYLGKDDTYISDLIKEIQIDYKYKYAGSKVVPLNYTYDVVATINGEYSLEEEDSKVWTKEYKLVQNRNGKITDKTSINITEPVSLNFSYYNNVVSNFRKELRLPIKASLIVVFKINVTGEVSGQKINDTKQMTLSFPLNQQAFKITEKYEENFNNSIKPPVEKKEKVNSRKLICGIILLSTAIFIFILFFREIFNIPRKNKYTIQLNKILKEYGDIIIEVINPVSEFEMDIVEVKNFNEMIDLEEELRVPIMFYETIEYLEGEFTLVHNNILYKFVLRNE